MCLVLSVLYVSVLVIVGSSKGGQSEGQCWHDAEADQQRLPGKVWWVWLFSNMSVSSTNTCATPIINAQLIILMFRQNFLIRFLPVHHLPCDTSTHTRWVLPIQITSGWISTWNCFLYSASKRRWDDDNWTGLPGWWLCLGSSVRHFEQPQEVAPLLCRNLSFYATPLLYLSVW